MNLFGGGAHLSWNALPAAQLEVADTLARETSVWSPVADGVSEIGGAGSFSQAVGSRARFFRLVRH